MILLNKNKTENSSIPKAIFVNSSLVFNLTKAHLGSNADLSKWFTTLIYFAYVITFLIGFFGNLLVCLVIHRKKNKKIIHILTLNLAVSDLIVLLVYLPMEAYQIHTQWVWGLGTVLCQILYPVNSCTVNASIYTLVVITRDRYIAIKQPMTAIKRKASSVVRWIIGIWIFAFLLSMPLMFVVNASTMYCNEHWPNIHLSRVYWFTIFAIQFVIPLIFIVLTYILIIYHIQFQNLSFSSANSTVHTKVTCNKKLQVRFLSDIIAVYTNTELKVLKRERKKRANCRDIIRRKKQLNKILKMIVVLVIVYFICVLPQHTVFVVSTISPNVTKKEFINYIFVTANFFMIANSSINPVIYGTLNDEIKKGVKKLLFPTTNKKNNQKQVIIKCFQNMVS
ncbi:somatostatin receptor type 5-like [Hydra vulgaris]|uniref:Somatostatin receptor type 5-like n=1 Tax=Hydra vulgaris TaxID=6087 RepID=A0ABM4BVB4_HYDVU